MGDILHEDEHAARVFSLARGVVGVMQAATLGVHVVGAGMAVALGLDAKHAVKQFDRLLSNTKLDVSRLFAPWVRSLISGRPEVVLAMDWTEFDADDHAVIAIYLLTSHGRATPLVWKTVRKSELKDARNDFEDEILLLLQKIIPPEVKVTVLADRGFGDQELYAFLLRVGWHFVIRFRGDIHVTNAAGERRPAKQWLHAAGKPTMMRGVSMTAAEQPVPAFVSVHARGMKDAWFIATSRSDATAAQIVKLYGRRFTIEETFRDAKDNHFGMGLKATHIGNEARRDKLLFVAAMATALLTLLGAAGERAGLDRTLKSNTSPHRQLSLLRQGTFWYAALPNMRDERLKPLMRAFDEILREHEVFRLLFGVI